MFGSSILDVAIGMAVVYMLFSLIASTLQEGIAAVVQTRAANLLQGLHSLFSGDTGPDDKLLLDSLYDHGLIRGLYRDPKKDSGKASALRPFDSVRMFLQKILGMAPDVEVSTVSNRILLPSYIPARTFALAMIDILSPAADGTAVTLERLRKTLSDAAAAHPNNKALEALLAMADSAGYDLTVFAKRLEDWYNDAMDRISGWYKKHTQNLLLVIGLLLAIAFNVNSIHVVQTLWTDKDAREAMVAVAKQDIAQGNPTANQETQSNAASAAGGQTAGQAGGQDQAGAGTAVAGKDLQARLSGPIETVQEIEDKKLLPLGWKGPLYSDKDSRQQAVWNVVSAIVGWLITALALSLGASFWFDTLNKFMVIRGTIKPDEKSQPEASKG